MTAPALQPSPAALIEALQRHADERPAAVAIRETAAGGRTRALCWRDLCGAALRLASALRAGGERPVVVVSAPNCLEQVVALLGGLWSDACVVVLPPDLPPARLRDVVRRSGASAAVAAAGPAATLAELGLAVLPLDSIRLDAAGAPASAPASGAGGSLALLTSGTTALPKLVRRSAPALAAVGRGCSQVLRLQPDDVMLIALPHHHSFGIDMGLLTSVTVGCRIELHDAFSPQRVLAALRNEGVTTLPAVPYLYDLLARSVHAGERPAPALTRAISAGGLLPRGVFDEFGARFGLPIGQIYGATEFGSVTCSDPAAADFRADTVGCPLPGVEIRILDPDAPSPQRELAPGMQGLVAVSAPSMLDAYLGDEASPLVDGFFLTGDLGRLDDRGCLELRGRLALLIEIGGRKVNPLEVEAVLESHPAIEAAVVVPVPMSRTVTRLKAILVPGRQPPPDAAALRQFLRQQLEDYKIPRSFEVRETLPRSPTGKLLRRELLSAPAVGMAEPS